MDNKKKKRIRPKHIKVAAAVFLSLCIVAELVIIIGSNISRVQRNSEELARRVENTGEKSLEPDQHTPEVTAEEGNQTETEAENADALEQSEDPDPVEARRIAAAKNTIIVLDPGHGKSSSNMTVDEKKAYGWVQNSSGAWGEWRHFKIGSGTVDCEGSGCNHRVTPNGACWYPIGNGDRASEPDINLKNAMAARHYLESMGYSVRMTRTSNDENPSITRRLEYCYPDGDKTKKPDAVLFLCIHSNAGGSRGTSYIKLDGKYDQAWIESDYVSEGNRLGKLCNDRIAAETSLSESGPITFEPELIAFCKSPVPCGYLEIGFFDNKADRAVLDSEYDKIGKAIAEGVDDYCKGK